MTSNLGTRFLSARKESSDPARSVGAEQSLLSRLIQTELKREFSPEFDLNRIDDIIIFNPLTKVESPCGRSALCSSRTWNRLWRRKGSESPSIAVTDWLLSGPGAAEEENSGALRRAIQRYIEDELSDTSSDRSSGRVHSPGG